MVNNLIATIINCSQKITWRKVLLVTFIAVTLVFMFSFSASADDELAKCTPKKYYDEMKDCNICSLSSHFCQLDQTVSASVSIGHPDHRRDGCQGLCGGRGAEDHARGR